MAGANAFRAKYWMLTIPQADFDPGACAIGTERLVYIRGQVEEGASGYLHHQLYVVFDSQVRLPHVKAIFGLTAHCEPTRSQAARDYVWKEATRFGEPYEFGEQPFRRNVKTDWEAVWEAAKRGDLESIPANVRVQSYSALRKIHSDYMVCPPMERSCTVFWGSTGTGKSRDAWASAGMEAYSKSPSTKFWDGYRGAEHCVIDEFRGDIGISHLLRWLDRYPVNVEIKGSAIPLFVRRFWITSNLHPREWYPTLDPQTSDALMRRLEIVHYDQLE